MTPLWQVVRAVSSVAAVRPMKTPHVSVLADEAIELLRPTGGKIIVDGTLGAGGHTARLSQRGARVIGLDRDPAALAIATERLGPDANVNLVHSAFADMGAVLQTLDIPLVDGILLDLGVSSIQIDTAARGFSFMRGGPIDMRMDTTKGSTALDLLRDLSPDDIANILYRYGDERYSRRIAPRLKDDARAGLLKTTLDLAKAVEEEIPPKAKRLLRVHPATKTFQALRIAVNGELDQLESFLAEFHTWLSPGARCVIISFHSLEDRLVKNCFRDLGKVSSLPRQFAEQAGERTDPVCTLVTRKPISPTAEEIASNPRARSAKMRACERAAA